MSTSEQSTQMAELKADIEELLRLQKLTIRSKIKNILAVEIRKAEADLSHYNLMLAKRAESETSEVCSVNKRYTVELKTYAFDQSPNYVKIYLPLQTVSAITDHNIKFEKLTKRSLELRINDLEKDFVFVINNLLEDIIEEKCYSKVKTDMVIIYLKKAKEGAKWEYATSIEKRIKEKKANDLVNDSEVETNDPGAGLMDIMKKMYQSGDSEMKQVIAKAWTEAQDKRDQENIKF